MVASVDCLVVYQSQVRSKQTNKLTKNKPVTYPIDKIRNISNPRHLWQIGVFQRDSLNTRLIRENGH